MKIFRWICFFFELVRVGVKTEKLHELIHTLNPYGTVIFTDNLQEINFKQNIFLGNLMNRNPSIIIDLNDANQTNDYHTFKMTVFQNPRRSATYIVIPSKELETSRILDNIVKISPVSSRPKTLLFLPTNCSDLDEKKILIKAWSMKFLDFSIVKTHNCNNHTLKTYNPFISSYYDIKSFKDENDIFPDKLKNVYEHPLKIRAYNTPPVLTIEIKGNIIVKVKGTRLPRIKYIAEKLNFKLHFMEDPHNVTETFDKTIENLESNKINTSPIGILLTPQFQNKNIVYGNPMNIARVVVVVPIIKIPKINGSTETLVLLSIFFIILIIFYLLIQALKLDKNFWNIFKIYGILIGISMSQPRKKIDRIIFITVTVLSIIFSNDYFSTLAEVKILFVEEKLDTYEDIKRIGAPIYVSNFYADNRTEGSSGFIFQKINSFHECIEKIIETNSAACTSPSNEAEHYSKTIQNFHGQPIMKITDLSFQEQFDAYLYEKASPFAEKIEKSLRQILESGMISVHDSKARNKIRFIDSKQSYLLEETLLNLILSVILCAGCTIAIITFLCELL